MTSFARARERIDQVIVGEMGADVTLRARTSTFDETTGKTTNTDVDTVLKGVLQAFRAEQVDGEVVRVGDKRVTLSSAQAPSEPVAGRDKILIGAEVFQILTVEAKYTGPDPSAYVCHVRK